MLFNKNVHGFGVADIIVDKTELRIALYASEIIAASGALDKGLVPLARPERVSP